MNKAKIEYEIKDCYECDEWLLWTTLDDKSKEVGSHCKAKNRYIGRGHSAPIPDWCPKIVKEKE